MTTIAPRWRIWAVALFGWVLLDFGEAVQRGLLDTTNSINLFVVGDVGVLAPIAVLREPKRIEIPCDDSRSFHSDRLTPCGLGTSSPEISMATATERRVADFGTAIPQPLSVDVLSGIEPPPLSEIDRLHPEATAQVDSGILHFIFEPPRDCDHRYMSGLPASIL